MWERHILHLLVLEYLQVFTRTVKFLSVVLTNFATLTVSYFISKERVVRGANRCPQNLSSSNIHYLLFHDYLK